MIYIAKGLLINGAFNDKPTAFKTKGEQVVYPDDEELGMCKCHPRGLMDENEELREEIEKLKLQVEVDAISKENAAKRIMELENMLRSEVEH